MADNDAPEPAEGVPEPEQEENKLTRAAMLDANQAGELLLISGHRVRQLAHEGHIKQVRIKGVGIRFPLKDAIQGYLRYRNNEARRSVKSVAATRMSDAKAREVELRIAEREGGLVDIENLDAIVEEIVGTVLTELSGLPARCTRDLQTRRTIETVIHETRTKLADIAAKKLASMGDRGKAIAAKRRSGAGRMGGGEPDLPENGSDTGAA